MGAEKFQKNLTFFSFNIIVTMIFFLGCVLVFSALIYANNSESTPNKEVKNPISVNEPVQSINQNNSVFDNDNTKIIVSDEKYITLNEGNYTLIFTLEKDKQNNDDSVGTLHVIGLNNGQQSYTRKVLNKDFSHSNISTLVMPIYIKKDATYLRALSNVGNGKMMRILNMKAQENIVLEADTSIKRKSITYEEEVFATTSSKIIDDEGAHNKKSIRMTSTNSRYSVFGPYSTKEQPGNHRAYFRMKVDDNTQQKDIAVLEVFNSDGDGKNKSLTIKTSDFTTSNMYQNFYIDYTRTSKGSLEFRIHYLGGEILYFDHVKNEGVY